MKNRRFMMRLSILAVMIAAVGYTLYINFSEERGLVDAGDEAPNFAVKNLTDDEIELADYRGDGVYINFWATYCTYCRDKMGYLQDHYEDYEEEGVKVLHVNVDETTLQVERHKERFGYDFDMYIDRGMLVSNEYGVHSLPAAYLIDENGEVIERHVGAQTEQQVLSSLDRLIPGS
ncbi:thiol-disulfide oxidoreductase ResA [Salisediminibacterium halotolerans]|uniref:Peroxiredoxin n=1 Tax=Salisediminibacterium halotolerans TaxID=517425 RepID=A0A1H9P786_9BACI|nr:MULTISPECIES: thiol-disulfide oxidoreductase ResA [Salisediminibacterium]RLJ77989.1 peroxiredoxin [Actinophytocola xinjiangensis]RPE88673.1 peroxiredoxin [Salisediminibacterium halotolerans]TWG36966.1 peroxiredoxin [Salisediminibacterium halotolerans]SER44184.1 Peroxiredoxin [Salisediminibacterium haloalkalitolerans]GEL08421.1 thioredoxin-like protein YneN [Salisediminibacterium halotolerans]